MGFKKEIKNENKTLKDKCKVCKKELVFVESKIVNGQLIDYYECDCGTREIGRASCRERV